MRDHLAPFRAGIEALAANSGDVVDQAILLWNAIYDAVLRYRHRHPGWIYVRHEDLSRDPVSRFSDLFQSLGLKHTDSVRRAIADFSGPHNPGEQHFGSHIRRDSGSNIWNWTKRLTPGEIRHVRKQTETIADQFYGEEDWRGF
jgi:hypothetical protein